MKTYFVVNPQSANGSTGRRWPEIHARLRNGLGEFGHAFTERPMHGAELARAALREGYRCIVAVGGDGTLNEVVNGFFEDGRLVEPEAFLAVLPRGTGGDFRRTFDWDESLDQAIARLRSKRTRPLDVGQVEFVGHDDKKHRRYFANIASFGVSGQVDAEVNRSSKALGGKLSFMLGSVKALWKYSDRAVRLSCDGSPFESLRITAVAVANGRYFGGGMMVAPSADPCDGWFDITIWSGYGLFDFALRQKSIYDGSHVSWKGTRLLRCQTLLAESEQEVLLDIDGEQPGKLPCRMTILPGAIRLLV